MRIYVGNQMRGVPESNYPWFERASAYLIKLGHDPVTPVDLDKANGFEQGNAQLSDKEIAAGLRVDFAAILDADAVALGPDWQDSFGAKAEKQVAEWIGLPVYLVDPDNGVFTSLRLSQAEGEGRA